MQYDNAKLINSSLFDRTNGVAPTTTTGYAQRLNGSANEKYGLAKSISVMPGDVINAEVYAKYVDPNSANWTGALSTLMSQIAANTAGVVVDGATYTTSTATFPAGFAGLQGTTDNGAPRAYLNWLVFDRNYVFITGGFKQITTAAKEAGTDVAHERIFNASPITITQPGYVYIYLSNEGTAPVEVFFDDFKVTHTKSPVIQMDDYYAFGLTFNSYQRENSTINQYLYNGKEKQDELGLEWLDYGARMYDPTIARWMAVDPLSELSIRWSPYTYCYNSPLIFIDPDGMFGDYYTTQGKYLGSDGIDDKKVYTADKATTTTTQGSDGKETTTTTFENSKEIGKTSDFVAMNGHTISSDETKKDLVGLAIYLRNEEGIEGAKVNVTGGDRDAKKNKATGGSPTSPHMAGTAADITVTGMTNEQLSVAAANSGLFTGVIFYPNMGDTKDFGTHLEPRVTGMPRGCDNPSYSNISIQNYQNLGPHTHVDNRPGTGVTRRRYIGDTSQYKENQSGVYIPWVSNNQVR